MKNKKSFFAKYGQLTGAVLNHIGQSLYTGIKTVEATKRGVTLTGIIESVDYLLKSAANKSEKNKRVKKILKNLEKRQIINIKEEGDNVYVEIRNKNHPLIIKHSIKSLFDFKKKNKKWQGKWYVVFFDVPEIQRNKRDYLRKLLKILGFYQYQESVYIFPYECEKEINLIKKIVEGGKYIKYIIAEKIEDEERIIKFFGLR